MHMKISVTFASFLVYTIKKQKQIKVSILSFYFWRKSSTPKVNPFKLEVEKLNYPQKKFFS